MEDTLGKRICTNRKRLGLTQDALADQLGVTAQAVSKWENDQSCPDITMVPRLAQIFGITTDELLGMGKQEVHTAEIVTEKETEPEGIHISNGGDWELKWDSGRKTSLALGLWILLTGGLLLLLQADVFGPAESYTLGLWDILWPVGLLVFGLFGLFPKFSLFRLGCALFGIYYLLALLRILPFLFGSSGLLPIFLLLFGLWLLTNALGKPKKGQFQITHDGKDITGANANYCHLDGECFDCAVSFGEKQHPIVLPRLAGGEARVSFGQMTIDLTGCEELADGATIDLNCSFGELEVLVPKRWRVVPTSRTSFASIETKGSTSPDANAVLNLNCSASFGEISIRYI